MESAPLRRRKCRFSDGQSRSTLSPPFNPGGTHHHLKNSKTHTASSPDFSYSSVISFFASLSPSKRAAAKEAAERRSAAFRRSLSPSLLPLRSCLKKKTKKEKEKRNRDNDDNDDDGGNEGKKKRIPSISFSEDCKPAPAGSFDETRHEKEMRLAKERLRAALELEEELEKELAAERRRGKAAAAAAAAAEEEEEEEKELSRLRERKKQQEEDEDKEEEEEEEEEEDSSRKRQARERAEVAAAALARAERDAAAAATALLAASALSQKRCTELRSIQERRQTSLKAVMDLVEAKKSLYRAWERAGDAAQGPLAEARRRKRMQEREEPLVLTPFQASLFEKALRLKERVEEAERKVEKLKREGRRRARAEAKDEAAAAAAAKANANANANAAVAPRVSAPAAPSTPPQEEESTHSCYCSSCSRSSNNIESRNAAAAAAAREASARGRERLGRIAEEAKASSKEWARSAARGGTAALSPSTSSSSLSSFYRYEIAVAAVVLEI